MKINKSGPTEEELKLLRQARDNLRVAAKLDPQVKQSLLNTIRKMLEKYGKEIEKEKNPCL